tara:strand:+ start:17 stop:649 length:633 start_codon:yes stop_codon:yes gene_type:complete
MGFFDGFLDVFAPPKVSAMMKDLPQQVKQDAIAHATGGIVSKGVQRSLDKATKGLKKTQIGKALKGLKRGAKKVMGKVNLAGEVLKQLKNKEVWEDGVRKAGKVLQAPMKAIRKNDPIAKKMGKFGGFSPISLASGIVLGPAESAGNLLDLSVNKKRQKKLKEGDAGEILDTALSGVGVIPIPGNIGKGLVRGGAKATARAVGKGIVRAR